jgi:hypothetical protein
MAGPNSTVRKFSPPLCSAISELRRALRRFSVAQIILKKTFNIQHRTLNIQ